jgi:hypothetical protein
LFFTENKEGNKINEQKRKARLPMNTTQTVELLSLSSLPEGEEVMTNSGGAAKQSRTSETEKNPLASLCSFFLVVQISVAWHHWSCFI